MTQLLSPIEALSEALYTRLTADLVAPVANRVYSHIVKGEQPPYVFFGAFSEVQIAVKGANGVFEDTCEVHCISDKDGNEEAMQVADQVVQSVTASKLSLTGFTNVGFVYQGTVLSQLEAGAEVHWDAAVTFLWRVIG